MYVPLSLIGVDLQSLNHKLAYRLTSYYTNLQPCFYSIIFLSSWTSLNVPFFERSQETPLPFKLQVKPTTRSVISNVISCGFNDTAVNDVNFTWPDLQCSHNMNSTDVLLYDISYTIFKLYCIWRPSHRYMSLKYIYCLKYRKNCICN